MKIIDLTHPIAENMPMYPGTDTPTLNTTYSHDKHGFMETHICLSSHTGTHIDAPAHIYANGFTLDKYPVEHFVGKALLVDCSKLENEEKISIRLLEEKGKTLSEVDFILFFTGHSKKWGNSDYYFSSFPIMSHEVIEWINQRKLKGIGIDAPSFDPVMVNPLKQTTPDELHNHQAILKTNHTILIENICNLEKIGNKIFTLCALPLNTKNADGCPARVIAIIN